MAKVPVINLRKGHAVNYNNDVCVVVSMEHKCPPRMASYVQMSIRSISTKKVYNLRLTSNESLEGVNLAREEYEFSYIDGMGYHFMNPDTYEDITVSPEIVEPVKDYLMEGNIYILLFTDETANVTKVANTYLRHKVMAEAEDETILDLPQTEYAQQITDIARFMLYLLEEKSRLYAAIRKAKDALDMDMDSEVSLNAARQSVARTFKRMNDLRSSEQLLSGGGTGYRFNAEGNQISYCCDVKRVTTINYDRKVIHAALSKLNRQADETSNRLDLCLVTSKVDYAVPFDVNASFAEAFETYLENAKG